MLATLGDLVDDIVVQLRDELNIASDTNALISRRRGGSAANVAEAAARGEAPVRFLGQVGTDPIGDLLVGELSAAGVDVSHVRRKGVSGSIVVLVDTQGERSMLTDRRTCLDLSDPEPTWLTGVTTLHVPLYSLTEAPLSDTSAQLIAWAHEQNVAVSIDVSSVSVMEKHGLEGVGDILARSKPAVIFANDDEAQLLGIDGAVGESITVVKRGGDPAEVHRSGAKPTLVPVPSIGPVTDSTGAGDAFSAGFLTTPGWMTDPVAACEAGHAAAARLLTSR